MPPFQDSTIVKGRVYVLGLGSMDEKSYPDIFRLNINIRYISRYFFHKVREKVRQWSNQIWPPLAMVKKPMVISKYLYTYCTLFRTNYGMWK